MIVVTGAVDVADEVAKLDGVDVTALDRVAVEGLLQALARVRAWLDARQMACAARLAELSASTPSLIPTEIVAEAGRTGGREAVRVQRRAEVAPPTSPMHAALARGAITAGHVDAWARALVRISDDGRSRLTDDVARWVTVAGACTVEQFERRLRAELAAIDRRAGLDLLERQRRNTRLRWWVERDTGMWRLSGEFDPVTGLAIEGRLRNLVEALFHDAVPDTCPPGEDRHDHLRALALAQLVVDGRGRPPGIERAGERTEVCVVVDIDTLCRGHHEGTLLGPGVAGVELPIDSVRRMLCTAELVPVWMNRDGVVLQLGRTTRLANRAQRRALRAMYPTCAFPDCRVAARDCQPHHLQWWRAGGSTDLENLLPLCSRHHHAVHEGGWKLALGPGRSLTVVAPDGVRRVVPTPAMARAG